MTQFQVAWLLIGGGCATAGLVAVSFLWVLRRH